LVLLDIGLPTLNGIEAARQIRAVSPHSKILFVSQESSADIVQAALETGAQGYVCKIDAPSELLTALETIFLGRKYRSKSVADANIVETSVSPALANDRKPIQKGQQLRTEKGWYHEVGFYPDDGSVWDARADLVRAALKNGNAAVVIASESHHSEFLSRLQACGVDVRAAIEQGWYIAHEVTAALSSMMVNDLPDPLRFSNLAGELIARAAARVTGDTSRVFVCGEGPTLLWEQGNEEGAVQLEHLWDEMAKNYGIQVHCGYLLSSFHGETMRSVLGRICAEHSVVLPL
jgi:CheY-like chemotaxis protein